MACWCPSGFPCSCPSDCPSLFRTFLRLASFRPLLGVCICYDCWYQFRELYTDWMTVPNLAFTALRKVSMEHLWWVWHASRERLPFRTPDSVPLLGLAYAPIVETRFPELAVFTRLFTLNTPRYFLILLWFNVLQIMLKCRNLLHFWNVMPLFELRI